MDEVTGSTLRTAHAVTTVVAQVAVPVADRDGATIVTSRRVALEASELFVADRRPPSVLGGVDHRQSGSFQHLQVDGTIVGARTSVAMQSGFGGERFG